MVVGTLRVVHVRRRLSPVEDAIVGPVRDLRWTGEMWNRAHALALVLGYPVREVLRMEGLDRPQNAI